METTSEETKTANNNGSGVTEDPKTISLSVEEYENLKGKASAQSGVDFANTKLREEAKEKDSTIEELRNSLKAGMNDKQLKDLEGKEKDERLTKVEAENRQIKETIRYNELNTFKLNLMADNDISIKFANFISGNSEDEIRTNVELFKKLNEEQLKSAKVELVNGKIPQAGATETTGQQMSRADLDKLDPIQKNEVLKKGTKIIE